MIEQATPPVGNQPSPTPPTDPTTTSAPPNAPAAEPTAPAGSLLNEPTTPQPEGKPAGAPETYTDFTAPEGYEIDKEALAEATPIFKELGLSQESAQKLVDFYSKQSQQAAEAPIQLWKETQEAWVKEIKADPEIGGRLDEVKTSVARMLDGLGNPKLATEFRQAMDYTGAGNNPAFIRVMNALAKQLTEGSHVRGNSPSPAGQGQRGALPSAAKAMYPDLPSAG